MASSSSLNAINKIHINSSTKMTLSDRFTAFSARPKINPRTQRKGIESPVNNRVASIANRRLLKQLAQKHTMEAALKLKRRSMRARSQPTAAFKRVSNGQPLKRGTIKALRLGPSGRPLKANSISNVATMEADLMGRRTNSVTRIGERVGNGRKRLYGARFYRKGGRPVWGGTISLLDSDNERSTPVGMRSRSRSRTRQNPGQSTVGRLGGRGRSNSRLRQPVVRSRSRSRNRVAPGAVNDLPITSRLGRRPLQTRASRPRARSGSRSRLDNAAIRRPRGAIASGRIQKRRNSVKATSLAPRGIQNRLSRTKGRLAPTAANQRLNRSTSRRGGNATTARGRARSRSRTNSNNNNNNRPLQRNNSALRSGAAAGALRNRRGGRLQRGRAGPIRTIGRRGRSQQRGSDVQRNGNGQQQQRQNRSRSRGRTRGGRNLGGIEKADVKKEDLDKELDQYMSSTKAEGLFN